MDLLWSAKAPWNHVSKRNASRNDKVRFGKTDLLRGIRKSCGYRQLGGWVGFGWGLSGRLGPWRPKTPVFGICG